MKQIFIYTVIACLSFLIAASIAACGKKEGYEPNFDDTDNKTTSQRSDMTLLTDHGTGCQYLYKNGSLIHRMNKEGKQVCQ